MGEANTVGILSNVHTYGNNHNTSQYTKNNIIQKKTLVKLIKTGTTEMMDTVWIIKVNQKYKISPDIAFNRVFSLK